jgi:hypothetical protein
MKRMIAIALFAVAGLIATGSIAHGQQAHFQTIRPRRGAAPAPEGSFSASPSTIINHTATKHRNHQP